MTGFRPFARGHLLGSTELFMRKSVLIPAFGLLAVCLSSAFWMVSAADPAETVRLSADVNLQKDSDFLTGFIPARTTIGALFENHMVQGADTPVLISIDRVGDRRAPAARRPALRDRSAARWPGAAVRVRDRCRQAPAGRARRARRRPAGFSPPSSASRNRPPSSPSKARSIARPIR